MLASSKEIDVDLPYQPDVGSIGPKRAPSVSRPQKLMVVWLVLSLTISQVGYRSLSLDAPGRYPEQGPEARAAINISADLDEF